MKHIIDIDAWERRDNYGFFRNFVNSWYSVTTEIDCTEASAAARAAKRSFFLYYLYAVVRSANEVDELRYRTDKEGRVVFHDRVDIISPPASIIRIACSTQASVFIVSVFNMDCTKTGYSDPIYISPILTCFVDRRFIIIEN